MSRSKVLLVAVVVAVLGLGAGASLAATGARSEQAPAPTPQALGPTTSHDLEFVPVDPCRLADTRQGGGIVGTNATRNFLVSGSAGFPAQGGTSGGCGVPEGALAAELTIISADATAPGFLRAYPFGGVADRDDPRLPERPEPAEHRHGRALRGHLRVGPVGQVVPGLHPGDHRRERLLHAEPLRFGRRNGCAGEWCPCRGHGPRRLRGCTA